MRSRPVALLRALLLTWLLILAAFGQSLAQERTWRKEIFTPNGIVVFGYGAKTHLTVITYGNRGVWEGDIKRTELTQIPLQAGNYTLEADDELKLITCDLQAYLTGQKRVAQTGSGLDPDALKASQTIQKDGVTIRAGSTNSIHVIPVPWVADQTYAATPPSFVSSHTIFNGVPTRLKATIRGGIGPYKVVWDPGDGTTLITLNNVTDIYNGLAPLHTYAGIPIGTQLRASVTVTDVDGNAETRYYYMLVSDPANRASRSRRSADEGLWALHTYISRQDNYATNGNPAVSIGYVNYSTGGTVASTSMTAIAFENTGRSISGGLNFSNDSAKDPYVDDLNRLINYLTDSNLLVRVAINPTNDTQHYASGRVLFPDTHGPGGVPNGFVLKSNNGQPAYQGGMHLQAIAQAGYVSAPVPNRTQYATYYDLIGDFVDGFQWGQGETGYSEGGWRYDLYHNYNDSDGSSAAWVSIGLLAAQAANQLTPGAPKPAPIVVDPIVIAEHGIWLNYDQVSLSYSGVFGINDFGRNGSHNTRYTGGFGYTSNTNGTNAGKTGGGLVGLKLLAKSDSDFNVLTAISFLYRNFNTNDTLFGWSSSRDSYGMYNLFKGLNEAHVTTLTDPFGSNGNDLDGYPLRPFDWYGALVDFIAGTSATDLGHQIWPGNNASGQFVGTQDGHFESTGSKPGDYWGRGNSDGNSGASLITAWNVNILAGSVLTPAPVAFIAHPDASSGETYIPLSINGVNYQATFDPAGSYELNPNAAITHVKWVYGDGTVEEYDLPFPGTVGGAVPSAPGVDPAGNTARHHYAALGDYTLTLTVTDTAGNTASTSQVVHVIPNPYPPVAVLDVTAQGGSSQDGDTVGVLSDGTVTLTLDGSASFNPDPASVATPHNPSGISAFSWEWPTNPSSGFNSGQSEIPPLYDQGTVSSDPNLNTGSKDGVQTYTFRFDPSNIPSAITIGLKVKSNINTSGGRPDTTTILKQITLKPNAQVQPRISDLTITKTASPTGTVNVGQNLTYTLTVLNKGKGAAKNAVVSDTLPASLIILSINVTGGGVVATNGNAVTVTYAALAQNVAQTITIAAQVKPDQAGGATVNNVAGVTSIATDPNPNDNSSSAAVTTAIPTPVLTTLNPSSATVGDPDTALTVNGTGFVSTSQIKWNGTNLPTTFVNPTQLRTTIPTANLATATIETITVVNPAPDGTSNSLPFTVNNPVPTITTISPTSAILGVPDTPLTVNGTKFVTGAAIKFDSTVLTTNFVSATQLTATIPATSLTAGIHNVTVTNPAPGGGTSNSAPFTVNNPVPVLSGVTPNAATAGSSTISMTLSGSRFVPGAIGQWNGAARTTNYVSATTLMMVLPRTDLATPGTFNISVANPGPGGGTSNTVPFTVNGIPQVTVSAATASRSGNVTVTFTLKNIGTATATNCVITGIKLSGTSSLSPSLPYPVGSLAPGATINITATFPGTITSGSKVLVVTLSASGSTLSASKPVIVP